MANAAVVECYATLTVPFNVIDREHPLGHRGADYRRSAGQPVVAYEACTVVYSDSWSSILGYCLIAQRHRDGMYIGWAHLKSGTRAGNGTVLLPGDTVAIVAGSGDGPGTAWTGPHIHTTEGPEPSHIFVGDVSDPNPDIQNAKTSTAGGGTTPIPEEEEDMPIFEFIQTPDGTVWFCVNRIHRYGIPGSNYLASYQSFAKAYGGKGTNLNIIQQANGNAFGSPVYNDGAPEH